MPKIKEDIRIDLSQLYQPQPKQKQLHKCKANEILFGGAAGPGKSHALRWEALDWCMRIPGLQVYLFRRTFPELEDNHILPSLREFPKELGKFKKQDKRWEFYNGSMLHFSHCQHESDVFQYQGAEIHLLIIDELTTFSEFIYDYLRGRVRITLDIPKKYRSKIPGITCATNPGGVGHAWVKRRWVDYAKPYELKKAPSKEGGMTRCYIPGLLRDNKILFERDPNYVHRLDALPEPYRTAYKDGNWDIFLGQAFNWAPAYHICKPLPVPEFAPLYMTFDWGYMRPFSVGWWWEDEDHRLYRFMEWYGWNGTPDQGLRWTDVEIAKGIIEREKAEGIEGRQILRLCDPTCFNKKPDYKGGGQGPSTFEVFMRYGLKLLPGDANRKLKVRQFHERLRIPDGVAPMVQIYPRCEQFIRTIPLLQSSQTDPEDIDTTNEDHIYDETCHVFMARPIEQFGAKIKEIEWERERQRKLSGLDSDSRRMAEHLQELKEEIEDDSEKTQFADINYF